MSSAVTVAMTADDDAVAVKSHFLSARRSRRFLFALLTPIIFTCSATIFGFPAVADALRRSGEYEELCPTGKSMPCAEQTLFFGKLYVIIASCFFTSYIFYGSLEKIVGPRYTCLIGHAFYATGTILLAYADSKLFDVYLPAACFIGAAGPAAFLASLHVCNLFKDNSKVATVLFIAAMCGSSLTYLLFGRLILAGISKKAVFLCHFAWICQATLILGILQPDVCFTPHQDIHFHSKYSWRYTIIDIDSEVLHEGKIEVNGENGGENGGDGDRGFSASASSTGNSNEVKTAHVADKDEGLETREPNQLQNDSITKVTQPARQFISVWDAVRSWEFGLLLVYGSVTLLRFNFYLATALNRIDEANGGTFYVDVLFLLLPLIGAVTSLTLVTVVINYFGINGVSRVATFLGLVYGCLVLSPGKISLLLVFISISLHRAFFFSFSYPYISSVFGHQLYGRLNGILMTISGAISLLQYPLIDLVEKVFGGQYFYVDLVVFAISGVCLFLLLVPLNVYIDRKDKCILK